MSRVERWIAHDGALRRPGRPSRPLSGFVAFEPGAVQPRGRLDAGGPNVGCRIPTDQLTVHDGDLVLTAGQEVSGLDIHGQVRTAGPLAEPAYVHDCIIRGNSGATTGTGMAIGHNWNLSGTVFEWCRFDGTGNESAFTNCVAGGGFDLRWCELLRGVDGVHVNQPNTTIEACRIYHMYYFSFWNDATNSPRNATFTDWGGNLRSTPFIAQASGDTHNDCIQLSGGTSGHVIRGNYIGGDRLENANLNNLDPTVQADYEAMMRLDASVGTNNAAIMLNGNAAAPIGVLIEDNWLHGGNARVNFSSSGTDVGAGVTVRNNRFLRSSYGYAITVSSNAAITHSGNVYDDDGTPVPFHVRS